MPKIANTDIDAANCPNCGSLRPAQEFKTDIGCLNCRNLEFIAKQEAERASTQAKADEAAKKINEDLKNLPSVRGLCSALYDNETGAWWFGINLAQEKVDPVNLLLIMDQAKVQLLANFADWKTVREPLKNKIIRVPVDGAKDLITEAVKKAGELKDKVKDMLTFHA